MSFFSPTVRQGFKDGLIVGPTALLLGLMYGLAALEAGFRPLEILYLSGFVYSAAVQFTVLDPNLPYAAWPTLLAGTAFICSRNILMSSDLARFSKERKRETFSLIGLTDVAWAVGRGYKGGKFWTYFWMVSLVIYLAWMGGNALSLVLPIPDHPIIAAAFAATPLVFFALVLALLWRQGTSWAPHLLTAFITFLGAKFVGLPLTFAALLGASIAAVAYVFLSPVEDD